MHQGHSFDDLLSQQKNDDASVSLLTDDEISTFPFGDPVQTAKLRRGFSFAPSANMKFPQGLKPAFLLIHGGTAEGRALPEIVGEFLEFGIAFARCV